MPMGCWEVQPSNAHLLFFVTQLGMLTKVMVLSFIPLRIVPVSSKIRFGTVIVIMDLVLQR